MQQKKCQAHTRITFKMVSQKLEPILAQIRIATMCGHSCSAAACDASPLSGHDISSERKYIPMLAEPPRALLSRDVPGDCPLGGPTMGLAAALGFPHAFGGGAGAALSVLA
jgi:hypothetical protein